MVCSLPKSPFWRRIKLTRRTFEFFTFFAALGWFQIFSLRPHLSNPLCQDLRKRKVQYDKCTNGIGFRKCPASGRADESPPAPVEPRQLVVWPNAAGRGSRLRLAVRIVAASGADLLFGRTTELSHFVWPQPCHNLQPQPSGCVQTQLESCGDTRTSPLKTTRAGYAPTTSA